MVRTVTKKYQVWLAGYYDDFNGARAISDYTNGPSDTSYSHLSSHFGNPLNGEAFLNPRYRWSVEEREQDSNAGNKISTTANNKLQNDGIFEWLTFDDTRLSTDDWEGRIQLQYPDGHVANRYKFNNDSAYGSDFYQRFINGHNSDASYIVPVGDNDASFGRSDMKRYDGTNYEAKDAGKTSTTGNFVQRAHLTGSWMGEKVEQASFSDKSPSQLFAEVTSPSKQPFLCVQTVRKHIDNDSPDVPAIVYDGPLNSRLDGDVFTTRIAVRSHIASGAGVWDDIKVKFEIGFPIAQAGLLNDEGYTGQPAIEQSLDLKTFQGASGSTSYDAQGFLNPSFTYTNDDSWLDVDFVFDYTNSEYDWYVNGIKQNTSGAESFTNGSATAAGIYGYQLSIESDESDGNYGYVSYLMLDRAGLVRYLSDDITSTEEVHIDKMNIKQSNNGISNCNLVMYDDPALTSGTRGNVATDYLLNLRSLFVSNTPLDWNLLVFGDKDKRIDRPIWKGIVDNFSITQKGRSRELLIKAVDSMNALNNQIPLWDVGQKANNATGDSTDYWVYDAQGFRDAMYLGGGKLKLLSNDVGFDKDSSYLETSTQRTQLGSGHPIQMYNNENTNTGPNDLEDNYEGIGILGFTEKRIADTNGSTETNTKTIAILATSSHGLSATDTISIQNTSNHNDTTVTIESVSNEEITFDYADLVYTPETAHIVYAGAYGIHEGATVYINDDGTLNDGPFPFIAWQDFYTNNPISSYYDDREGPYRLNVVFDADPNLKVGDYFYMNRRNKDHQLSGTSYYGLYEVRHKVKRVVKFRNYFNIVGGVSQLTGNPTVLWAVETYSPIPINTDYGDITSDSGMLVGDNRYQWSKDKGQTSGYYTTDAEKTKNRPVHARWMRDLPQSLWFQYHFGRVQKNPVNNDPTQQYMTDQSIGSTSTSVIITQDTYDNIPSNGVAEIWSKPSVGAEVYQEKFIYQAKSFVGGSYRLIGCKYINNSYTISSNNFILKIQDISDDYKHLWLLWSDMRNNGKANADGSTRKQKFGLQYPLSENYEFDLFYVDQFDAEGNIDKFASLKAGDDLGIWNLDATNDPLTNGAFSKPADLGNTVSISALSNNSGKLRISTSDTGSVDAEDYIHLVNTASHDGIHKVTAVAANTHFDVDTTFVSTTINTGNGFYCTTTGSDKDLVTYQDWEDKAGSLLVIDSSPFFNLNTHVNGGKTGQEAGGSTDLSDYVATRNGFPALIDNYWLEALASYQTVEDLSEHPNQDKLISDAQISPEGFIKNDLGVTVDDASKYDDSGLGILRVVMDSQSNENPVTEYFFSWENKLETQYSSSGNNNTPVNITWEGIDAVKIVNTGETHLTSGLKPGMLIKRTAGATTTRHAILRLGDDSNTGDETGLNPETTLIISRRSGNVKTGTDITWATTDSYTVPIQLGMIKLVSANTFKQDVSWKGLTLEEREEKIFEQLNNTSIDWAYIGFKNIPTYTTDITEDTTPEAFEVHATITSSFMLRLMMHIDGFYENTNGGTYWNHDKMRFLWNASIMDTWLPSAKVTSVFDINNVPITSMMTTYNDTSSNDSYGGVVDSRSKSLGSTLKQMREKTGFGTTNSLATTFSVLIGRDNRIEFRPKYNSDISFNRSNMLISKVSAQLSGQITNVRVYYNNNQSFVDYPATNLGDTTRWKILEHPKITSSREALIVAQKQYNTYSNNTLRMEISPLMPSGDQDKMIDTGRYGYIADPYIALQGTNDTVANVTNWTYIGTGGALFPGMVNALNGNMSTDVDPIEDRYGVSQETGTGDITWNNNYYWYGSNSVSHAVQIVHIPNDVPLVSDTTSKDLRIWVDLKSTQESDATIDTAEFTVHIADYNYNNSLTRSASSPSNNTSSKDVKHSGYYQIDIPQSYSTTQGKIVFSFNAEYCRALLRHRCGNPGGANILTNYTTNADSIFPLGKRVYTEMGGGFRDSNRIEWYAPKILICRDISYVPATYVQVTDLGLEMNNETMVIQKVEWGVSAGGIDNVKLSLERDESLSSERLLDYLLNQDNDGLQQGTGNGGSVQNPPIDWGSIGITPPSNLPNQDTDPSLDQSLGDGFKDNSDGIDFETGVTVGKMSKKTYGIIKGRMALVNDNLSGDSKFSILGQQKPSTTPSVMRGIEGMDVEITAISGTASRTADGYVFAGKGLQGGDFTINSQNVSLETSFIVPSDILSNRMSIQATATHSPLSSSGKKSAILYVTVINEQAGVEVTSEVNVNTGLNNRIIDILTEQPIKGLNTRGNKIKVIITRKPGTGDDDADSTSVVLKNLNVKMQRASAHVSSSASDFSASLN
jgi:hypothetical protein